MNKGDHNRLREKIDKLIWTDPEDLFPGNEHLLDEAFNTLGRESAIDEIRWVAKMEGSIAAVNHGKTTNQDKDQVDDATTDTNTTTQTRTDSRREQDNSEGSRVWKKERWK